jgi:hypothetical protein
MKRLSITAKIWLSIGVFGLGYVLATVLGQIQGLGTEGTLRSTSEALFPATQRSQEAESAFQQMVKGFSDAVMVQDASGLAHAAEDGRRVVENLNTLASVTGLSAQRFEDVRKLAASVEQYVNDAKSIYGAVLANPANMTADMQERMKGLAARNDTIKASLQTAKEQASKDLSRPIERCAGQFRPAALVGAGGVWHHPGIGGRDCESDDPAHHHRSDPASNSRRTSGCRAGGPSLQPDGGVRTGGGERFAGTSSFH